MFDVRYKGVRLIPSKSAMDELFKHGLAIEDCKDILDNSYDAPRKRGKDTIEKWLDSGKKTYNVVIVKSYNIQSKEDIYLITHLGQFIKKKIKNK